MYNVAVEPETEAAASAMPKLPVILDSVVQFLVESNHKPGRKYWKGPIRVLWEVCAAAVENDPIGRGDTWAREFMDFRARILTYMGGSPRHTAYWSVDDLRENHDERIVLIDGWPPGSDEQAYEFITTWATPANRIGATCRYCGHTDPPQAGDALLRGHGIYRGPALQREQSTINGFIHEPCRWFWRDW